MDGEPCIEVAHLIANGATKPEMSGAAPLPSGVAEETGAHTGVDRRASLIKNCRLNRMRVWTRSSVITWHVVQYARAPARRALH
jgi:hypothetical protein